MAKIKVRLVRIDVINAGDPGEEPGEIYYRFDLDGKTIVERTRAEAYKAVDGGSIPLGQVKEADVEGVPGSFKLSGYVKERDNGIPPPIGKGKDEHAKFDRIFYGPFAKGPATEVIAAAGWRPARGGSCLHLAGRGIAGSRRRSLPAVGGWVRGSMAPYSMAP